MADLVYLTFKRILKKENQFPGNMKVQIKALIIGCQNFDLSKSNKQS